MYISTDQLINEIILEKSQRILGKCSTMLNNPKRILVNVNLISKHANYQIQIQSDMVEVGASDGGRRRRKKKNAPILARFRRPSVDDGWRDVSLSTSEFLGRSATKAWPDPIRQTCFLHLFFLHLLLLLQCSSMSLITVDESLFQPTHFLHYINFKFISIITY